MAQRWDPSKGMTFEGGEKVDPEIRNAILTDLLEAEATHLKKTNPAANGVKKVTLIESLRELKARKEQKDQSSTQDKKLAERISRTINQSTSSLRNSLGRLL